MSTKQVSLKPNIVISVAEIGSLNAWKIAGPQIVKCVPALAYWLIVPDSQLKQFIENSPNEYIVFPESLFIKDFSHKFMKCEGAALPTRKGWYLQQLIKLAALERACPSDRIVIWDADTVPLKEITFFDSQGNCIYYFGSEHHSPYFQNIERLLGLGKVNSKSFIAQNFPITCSQVDSFFKYVETRHKGKWWDAVIDSIDFDEASGFSEYETLGTFVASISTVPMKYQQGTWSRDGTHERVARMLSSRRSRNAGHDFIAIEAWNTETWFISKLRGVVRKVSKLFRNCGVG